MKNNKLTIKDSAISFISSYLICHLSVLLVSAIILFIGSIINPANIENFSKSCVGNLILSSTLYITMFLVYRYFTKGKENKILTKPTASKTITYICLAVISFFALYPIVNSFDFLLSNFGFKLNEPSFKLNLGNYFLCLVPMVILPAVCEELLFRGLIFKGLKQHGKNVAIFITSLTFALYHMSLQQTIYPLLFGLVLTIVMFKENNILYCILMHLVNNFIALTFMFLDISLFVNILWYYILAVILLITFIILLIYYIKNQKNVENIEKISKNNKFLLIIVLVIMFILWLVSNIYR